MEVHLALAVANGTQATLEISVVHVSGVSIWPVFVLRIYGVGRLLYTRILMITVEEVKRIRILRVIRVLELHVQLLVG